MFFFLLLLFCFVKRERWLPKVSRKATLQPLPSQTRFDYLKVHFTWFTWNSQILQSVSIFFFCVATDRSGKKMFMLKNFGEVFFFALVKTQARFTLSECQSDWYKVGYDPIHIRFVSASLQCKGLHLHWADRFPIDIFVCVLRGFLREAVVFLLFAVFENFCKQFFLSSDNALQSKVSACLCYFLKQFRIEGCLHFLWTPVLVNNKENFVQTFPKCVLSYQPVIFSSSRSSFVPAFRSPNIWISRLQSAFSPLLVQIIRLVRSGRFFLSAFLSGHFFLIRIDTGLTSNCDIRLV